MKTAAMITSRVFAGDRHAVILRSGSGRLVFDVGSSNSFEIDQEEDAALSAFSDPDRALESTAEKLPKRIGELIAEEALFGEDQRRSNPSIEHKLRLHEVVIQLANACNMACTYCYADEGEYGGGRSYLMSEKVARDTIDFVFTHRGGEKIGFGFLGGEPLLNLKTLRTFVTYARERGAAENVRTEFSVTTNGLPLTPQVIEFLKTHDISVRLSVDGTQEIHDKYRPDKKRLPTFDRIQEGGGRHLRESGIGYLVRTSMFGPEADRVLEQVRNLFEGYHYTRVKVDFLWGTAGTPGLIEEEDLGTALAGIDALSEWFRAKVLASELKWTQLLPYAKYIGRLRTKPVVSPIYLGTADSGGSEFGASVLENNGVECGAGVNVVSISGNGDIYSCHRTEGNPKYKIGTIYGGVRADALDYWHTQWRLEKSDCRTCWARYVCIGGCPAFGIYKHQDPMQVDQVKCQIRRRFIAWSVVLYHDLKERGMLDAPAEAACGSCNDQCDQD